MSVNEFPLAINATKEVMRVIDLYFLNKTFNDSFFQSDLLYLVMTLNGVLSNFETIT
jgi:hypothetical protein